MKKIVIGTRSSILAIKQAEIVLNKLKKSSPEYEYIIKEIKTKGDKEQEISLLKTLAKDLFVKEIEKELLENKINIAVHSMKDMPEHMPKGLIIGGIPDREDRRDTLLSNSKKNLMNLPKGSVVGTSSSRRKIQILNIRNDLVVKEIRGNIHTRINKMKSGLYDAIVLAAAGIKRVGLEKEIVEYFDEEVFIPAPAQGAICVQIREDDKEIIEVVKKINNEKLQKEVILEREFSLKCGGGCKNPVGVIAKIENDNVKLKGFLLKGNRIINVEVIDKEENYNNVVDELYKKLLEEIDETK